MVKSIKKTYNILIVTIAAIILSCTLIFLLIRIPSVQTFLINKVARYISGEIKTTVSVGNVKFIFFNRIELTDVLIKDQCNDTMIYAPSITAGIRQISRRNNTYKLGRVVIIKPVVGFNYDSTGLLSVNWYLNMLQKPRDSSSSGNFYFHINQIELSDARFSLTNKYVPRSKTPVDFNNLRLSGINGIVENLDSRTDSTSMDIYNLSFRDSTGFVVKKFSSNLNVHNQYINFKDVSIICDSSIINAERVGILADSSGSFRRFTEEVKLNIRLKKSLINSNDLKYFVPFLKDYNESIWISGSVTGTVAELKGRNIKVTYKDETYLEGNFDFSGLPAIDKTFMFIEVNDFRSISKDVEQIRIPGKGYILLPEVLRKLGVVSFSGTFTGFTTDFVTYGRINTNKGIISADLSLRPLDKTNFKVKGLVSGSGIDLGSITENPKMFGSLSLRVNIDGTASSFEKFSVNLAGKVDSVEINKYKYRNIGLNGRFTDKAWDGSINIEDENIHMELLGMFDFNRKLPEFDFSMNLLKANLHNLNLDKADTSSLLTMLLTANFNGNSIDNLNGEIKLLNSSLKRFGNKLDIYDVTVKTSNTNTNSTINIRTDFFDANLYGSYNSKTIVNTIKNKLSVLMPSRFEGPKTEGKLNGNNFIFDVKFKNTDNLNKIFRTGVVLSENSVILGTFSPDSIISVSANATRFAFNNYIFKDLSIEGKTSDSTSKIRIKSSLFSFSGLTDLKALDLNFSSSPDRFRFLVDWDNKDKIINKGSIIANGSFEKKSAGQKTAMLRVGLEPGDVYIRNNLWKINPSVISIDSSSIRVDQMNIRNDKNYFLIDGTLSVNPSDTLNLQLNGISIDPLNNLYERQMKYDPNMIKLNLKGTLNGRISLTNVYKNFMFESDLRVKDFSILGGQFGEIRIGSVWNNVKKVADLTASNDFEGRKMIDVIGSYDPSTRLADLTAKAIKLPVDILNPLLKVFASGITGTASGKVRFTGEFARPTLTGALMGENVSMKIDYLQTRYTFNDSIRFDDKGIKFNNIKSLDDRGNIAYIDGSVYHQYFKDFTVDLTIKANDCMVLNTRPKDNDLFYGTAYASGLTTIKSNGTSLSFVISAKTGKNTKFFIPLNKGLSVSERSFIKFEDSNPDKPKAPPIAKPTTSNQGRGAMDINFDLEVTPDAEVKLIFDSKIGDEMRGTGTGNLNINLSKNGEFKMYGDYIIEDGDYLFTLGNILNKKFTVQNGGKISFNGDMQDAEIDIKAVYKTKASLSEIMKGISTDPKFSQKIPVECQLNLTGNLFNPVVGFDIYLPTADEETRAYLKSMIKSDEEMSRQFLFLLVMNSFYADPSVSGNTQTTADMGSATVGVTTTEMLSNQLSNWLSQISKDFDIGVAYRPGSSAMPNSQEVTVALSTQILNDKVVINGNFDYGGNQSVTTNTNGNNALTGAFDVEVKLTEKIRFKVFNRSNDNFYIDNGIQYTQGVGLFFKQDFNKLKDLFVKTPKSTMKKEDETKIKKK